jgi:hypothetical protein
MSQHGWSTVAGVARWGGSSAALLGLLVACDRHQDSEDHSSSEAVEAAKAEPGEAGEVAAATPTSAPYTPDEDVFMESIEANPGEDVTRQLEVHNNPAFTSALEDAVLGAHDISIFTTDWSGGFRLHLQTEADLSALSPEELITICEQMGDFLAEDPPGITFNGPAVYALGQHIAAEGGGPSFETLDYVYNSSFWPPDRRGACVVIER